MRRRVLVAGASGQLGMALTQEFRAGFEVVEAVHHHPGPGQVTVDLADTAGVKNLLTHCQPQWILIAGAYCYVDGCETEWDLCQKVNVEGPRRAAQWAKDHGARVVFYSTDHIFDGGAPIYAEEDEASPLSRYAASKVEGERAVREALPSSHLILRTSGLYGADSARKNFVLRLTDRLRSGEKVPVPSDQWGSPTAVWDLARATRFLLENDHGGTFHATGPDFISRIDFARRICAVFGLDPQQMIPTPTAQLHQAARRPLKVRLDSRKLAALGAGVFASVDEGLSVMKRVADQGTPSHG